MINRINVKPIVNEILSDISELAMVSTSYPNNWNKFPSAIYSTNSKPHKKDLSMNEILTAWTITIELYSNKSLSDIQEKVINALSEIGFKNTEAKDANTADKKRLILVFFGIVDNQTKIVYQS